MKKVKIKCKERIGGKIYNAFYSKGLFYLQSGRCILPANIQYYQIIKT